MFVEGTDLYHSKALYRFSEVPLLNSLESNVLPLFLERGKESSSSSSSYSNHHLSLFCKELFRESGDKVQGTHKRKLHQHHHLVL